MRHPTPDIATILVANSTTGKKGLNPSSVGGKQVKDQVERVSKEAVGRLPQANKGMGKWRRSLRKTPPPCSEAPFGNKLMAALIAAVRRA